MGDLANMTSVHGEVDGFRLLRWLRGRAEMFGAEEQRCVREGCNVAASMYRGRCVQLAEMADDLERELTPPDYPEDDDDTVNLDDPAFLGRPEQE